jgi:uncharacterized coiled-coil protein SlyX
MDDRLGAMFAVALPVMSIITFISLRLSNVKKDGVDAGILKHDVAQLKAQVEKQEKAIERLYETIADMKLLNSKMDTLCEDFRNVEKKIDNLTEAQQGHIKEFHLK